MSLITGFSQASFTSANNSSTANLSALATFTGTSELTQGYNSIIVNFHADKNCNVYVDQSSDNTNWDITDVFMYNTLINNFSVATSVQATYYRVRVKNLNTTSATTLLRLQTILIPTSQSLPRSLSDNGLLKVGLYELEDEFGGKGQFTPMKELRVMESVKMVGTTFGASIDTNFWTATNTGAGSASGVSNAIATLSSGTANNGFGKLISTRLARFQFGQPLLYRRFGRVNTLIAANNTSYWGACTETTQVPQNGVAFSIDGSGVLSVNCFSNGAVSITAASGSFNGQVSEYIMDSNAHAYEIVYFTAYAKFFIDGILIHTFIPTTTVLYQTLNTPICELTVNSAGGVLSRTIECWNATIQKMGKIINSQNVKYSLGAVTASVAKNGAGILTGIIASTGANTGTLLIYDAITATNPIFSISLQANQSFQISDTGLPFYTGLCYTVTGANASVTLIYE